LEWSGADGQKEDEEKQNVKNVIGIICGWVTKKNKIIEPAAAGVKEVYKRSKRKGETKNGFAKAEGEGGLNKKKHLDRRNVEGEARCLKGQEKSGQCVERAVVERSKRGRKTSYRRGKKKTPSRIIRRKGAPKVRENGGGTFVPVGGNAQTSPTVVWRGRKKSREDKVLQGTRWGRKTRGGVQ